MKNIFITKTNFLIRTKRIDLFLAENLHGRAEFQIVISATLNYGWITHFNEVTISFRNESFFVQR